MLRQHHRRLGMETLEERSLLAAGILENGWLGVLGTKGNDDIQVQMSGSLIRVSDNGVVRSFSAVPTIAIMCLAGNDRVTVDDNVTIPVWVDGGKGNDTIKGGSGNDAISAWTGNDTILGGDGDDTIWGGAGADSIFGDSGTGDDVIYGGADSDTITGGPGSDSVYAEDGDDSVIHTVSVAGGANHYDGGKGTDTLTLDVTSAEAAALAGDIANLQTFIAANSDPNSGTGSGNLFSGTYGASATALGLDFRNFEAVNIIIDGNSAPTTDDVSATAPEDSASIAIVLTGSDTDGTVTHFKLSSLPTNGTLYTNIGLTIPAATGVDYAAVGNALTLYFVPNANFNGSVNFQYAAKDDDGIYDPSPATATINVTSVNDTPVAGDDTIISAINDNATFNVPQWALLANDTDIDNALTISQIVSFDGANFDNVSLSGSNVVVNTDGPFDPPDTAIFTYRVSDGSATDDAVVTVNAVAGGTITGTGNAEIIVGSDSADSISAGGGNDIVFGNNGNDTIDGGTGNDILVGGAGSDSMTGGTGVDTFIWNAGDQGSPGVTNHVYNFSGVTAANNLANAFEFEVSTTSFNNLNALDPASNANYVSSSVHEALDVNYTALVTDDITYWTTPQAPNGSNQVMWFQFNITEDQNALTQISIDVQAGRPDNTASGDTLDLGIWNDSTNDWELLQTQTYESGTVGNFTANLTTNLANYVDGSGHITLVLFNEDQSDGSSDGQILADHVAVTISTPGGTPTVVDHVTDFTPGVGGDVLNLDGVLPGSVNGGTAVTTLDDYLQFTSDGTNTTLHVDHDGGGTFQSTMDIILENVDLTVGGTQTTDQILTSLLADGNLQV